MPLPNANPDDPAGYAVGTALRLAVGRHLASDHRLEAYRRGEISLTGRPVLTGPMSHRTPTPARPSSRGPSSASSWPTSPAMPPSAPRQAARPPN